MLSNSPRYAPISRRNARDDGQQVGDGHPVVGVTMLDRFGRRRDTFHRSHMLGGGLHHLGEQIAGMLIEKGLRLGSAGIGQVS